MTEKIRKTDSEWRQILTPEQYQVARRKGTEPPGTGEYEDTDAPGTYVCVCCGQPLFSSESKYHSGSGWPSFWAPIDEAKVEVDRDTSHGMAREEVLCSRCDAHHSGCRRSEEHTSELQSHLNLVCRLLLEKKKKIIKKSYLHTLT